MIETLDKKLDKIDEVKARAEAHKKAMRELHEMSGKPLPIETAELDDVDFLDREEISALLLSYRASRSARSLVIEETPSAAQSDRIETAERRAERVPEKPKAATKAADYPPSLLAHMHRAPLGNSPSETRLADESAPEIPPELADDPEPVAAADTAELPSSPGSDQWIPWSDPTGYGAPPVEVDDAIAYQLRNGHELTTDYPFGLEWCQTGKATDVVSYRFLSESEASALPPWHEWKGGECPIDPSWIVQVRLHDYGRNDVGAAALERWQHVPEGHRNYDANIIAYRVLRRG